MKKHSFLKYSSFFYFIKIINLLININRPLLIDNIEEGEFKKYSRKIMAALGKKKCIV
jgi:hypothetical protein